MGDGTCLALSCAGELNGSTRGANRDGVSGVRGWWFRCDSSSCKIRERAVDGARDICSGADLAFLCRWAAVNHPLIEVSFSCIRRLHPPEVLIHLSRTWDPPHTLCCPLSTISGRVLPTRQSTIALFPFTFRS